MSNRPSIPAGVPSAPKLWRVDMTDDFGGLRQQVVHADNRDEAILRAGAMLVTTAGIPFMRLRLGSCEEYRDDALGA